MSPPHAAAAQSNSPAALAYATPVHATPKVALYRIAQFCWAVPLVLGLAILALYATTRARMLPRLGILTLVGGGLLLGIGFIVLAVFWSFLASCSPGDRQLWRSRALRLAGGLVLNVAVAFGCVLAGTWLMNRFTVTVINDMDAPLTDVGIRLPGHAVNLGTLPPGARVKRTFSLRGEGDLEFSAVHDGIPISGSAGDFIVGSLGNSHEGTVIFDSSGASATVHH